MISSPNRKAQLSLNPQFPHIILNQTLKPNRNISNTRTVSTTMDKVTIEELLGTSSQKGTGLVCAVERQGLMSATKKEKLWPQRIYTAQNLTCLYLYC
jgi:hypothetical protein